MSGELTFFEDTILAKSSLSRNPLEPAHLRNVSANLFRSSCDILWWAGLRYQGKLFKADTFSVRRSWALSATHSSADQFCTFLTTSSTVTLPFSSFFIISNAALLSSITSIIHNTWSLAQCLLMSNLILPGICKVLSTKDGPARPLLKSLAVCPKLRTKT